ncbi:MAG: alpha/beta hydrolase [Chloroflexota bacterium]
MNTTLYSPAPTLMPPEPLTATDDVRDTVGGEAMPFAFGPPDRGLFGWYHPSRINSRAVAVLLCGPVGWEGLAMHRTLRAMAERLSDAGFATLRFDMDGTGDSAGTDEDPQRVQAWVHSIRCAAAELRSVSGRDAVSLVGIHLGATLASEFAAADGEAQSAVLWAPVVGGKQMVREIRAYAALNEGVHPSGDQDAAGFLYQMEALDALSRLDLTKIAPPAPRVLLLRKGESTPEARVATAWQERGAQVTCEFVAGFDAVMQESRIAAVPDGVIQRTVAFLSDAHPARTDAPSSLERPRMHGVRDGHFEEELCFFGPGAHFFGVLTRPTQPCAERPTVVFLNTSDDHRIGPNRMYVPFSRDIARLGITSFRFDPTGVGDNRGPGVEDPSPCYSEQRVLDSTVVLDYLVSRGLGDNFVLVGLCSGAYVAFQTARKDRRVVGTVLLNPLTLTWTRGDSLDVKIMESFASPLHRRAMRQVLARTGHLHRLEGARKLKKRALLVMSQVADTLLPSRLADLSRVDRGFNALVERGVRVLLVFGDEDERFDIFNGRVALDGGYLRRHPRFHYETIPKANHTFTRVRDRRALFALLLEYLTLLSDVG